eukprot:5025710-Alexandrium_andersonii.AAC.1
MCIRDSPIPAGTGCGGGGPTPSAARRASAAAPSGRKFALASPEKAPPPLPVSYTHLRAHETSAHL